MHALHVHSPVRPSYEEKIQAEAAMSCSNNCDLPSTMQHVNFKSLKKKDKLYIAIQANKVAVH